MNLVDGGENSPPRACNRARKVAFAAEDLEQRGFEGPRRRRRVCRVRRSRQAIDPRPAAVDIFPPHPRVRLRVEGDLDRVSGCVQHLAVLSHPSAGDVDRIVGRNFREASGIESSTPANVLAWSMLDMIVERDAGD